MKLPDIILSLTKLDNAELRHLIFKCKEILLSRPADICSCHERDSSQVCDFCYKQGYRGHMQEDSSYKCDDCGLWSNSHTCDFCGKAI